MKSSRKGDATVGHFAGHWGAHLELVLLAVDDDGGDLLVHEDQDGAEHGWECRYQQRPPGIGAQWVHEPASVLDGRLSGGREGVGGGLAEFKLH